MYVYCTHKLNSTHLSSFLLSNVRCNHSIPQSGNKSELQSRLIEWTNSQHRRRVLERNAMRTQSGAESPLQGAINDALFRSSIAKSYTSTRRSGGVFKDSDAGRNAAAASSGLMGSISRKDRTKEGKSQNDNHGRGEDFNMVEPLINRRKALLRSNRLSFSKNKDQRKDSSTSNTNSANVDHDHDDTDMDADIDDEDESIDSDIVMKPSQDYLTDLRKTFYKNVETAPNNYQVKQLYQQAKRADQAGDLKSAKVYLEKLQQVTPTDTRVIRRLARLEMQGGNVHVAREILQNGLRSRTLPSRSRGDILQGLGKLELASGNLNSARKHFKDAIAAAPNFPNPYHALATLEHSLGNIRVATTILRSGLKHCPSNHRLHHALGDLYREAKMLDMAEKAYQKGLNCIDAEMNETGRNLQWSKSFSYTALSYLAYQRGEVDECREWLRKSVNGSNRMHAQGW